MPESKDIKPLKIEKLTKKFFLSLAKGVYLVSNAYVSLNKSVFAEYVEPLSTRNEQWKRIVESSASQRLCYVFKSQHDYESYHKNRSSTISL
ncbi:MAG: hypothetical protein WC581_03375 [Thermodesulfovibrionales bacterium]